MWTPCKDCEQRRPATKDQPSCHADCEVYADWQKEVAELRDRKRGDNLAVDFLCRGIERAKAIRHIRRKH